MSEQDWQTGNRAAYAHILGLCRRELGHHNTPDALLLQLEDARAALRVVCAEHGDNEWDDNLALSDVIEKHLARHLIQ